VPNVRELLSSTSAAGIWSGFDRGCVQGCTVLTCSCPGEAWYDYCPDGSTYQLKHNRYWSSTSYPPGMGQQAYQVNFDDNWVDAMPMDMARQRGAWWMIHRRRSDSLDGDAAGHDALRSSVMPSVISGSCYFRDASARRGV